MGGRFHFLFGKEQAGFAHHKMADFIARIPPTFKPHRPAAVGETRIPGYIIINTLVAIYAHTGFWRIEIEVFRVSCSGLRVRIMKIKLYSA